MRLHPGWIFALLALATGWYIVSTVGLLPPTVAIHFGADGAADGFATREQYRRFILALAILAPGANVALLALLPRLSPRLINVPHRDYWLAPERLPETQAFFLHQAFRLGSLLLWLIAGVHWSVLEANKVDPPRLPSGLFVIVLPLFAGGIALWAVAMWLRFRRPSRDPFDTSS